MNQPLNNKSSFVGVLGIVIKEPSTTVCDNNMLPSLESNVAVTYFGAL
nr:hypothetical protein [endosymbiont 'TC1' of Trimyema compressum]